mmetsp:Transcript_4966/g.8281  ORF Transcript_4966/g.8281 Transcript_4966/m.8281 type:complete len:403 (-) Transcript_4966:228-1436(-)
MAIVVNKLNEVLNDCGPSHPIDLLDRIATNVLHAIIRHLKGCSQVGWHDVRSGGHVHLCVHSRSVPSILFRALRGTDFKRRTLLVVRKVLEQLLVQIQPTVCTLEWLRLAMTVNSLPRPRRRVERSLCSPVEMHQARHLAALGPADALVNLIIHLVRLSVPLLSTSRVTARDEEGTGFPEPAVGLLVNVDRSDLGIGLEVVDEELTFRVNALVGARVEDGGGHANVNGHDAVGGEGGDECVDDVGVGVLFVLLGFQPIDDEDIEFILDVFVHNVFERIGYDQIGTRIIKAGGSTTHNVGTIAHRREMFLARLYDPFIDLNHGRLFDGFVFEDLAKGGSLATADDGDIFGSRVREHSGLDKGLVVFLFRIALALQRPIQKQHPRRRGMLIAQPPRISRLQAEL